MHTMICDSGVWSREIINMYFVNQMSGLVRNFNIVIYSDTISVEISNFA